jgi:hypothetical protein
MTRRARGRRRELPRRLLELLADVHAGGDLAGDDREPERVDGRAVQ